MGRGQPAEPIDARTGHQALDAVLIARLQFVVEQAFLESTLEIGDSRCGGFMVLAVWTGGAIPKDQFAMTSMLSPTVDPRAIAPYLRSIAGSFERFGE